MGQFTEQPPANRGLGTTERDPVADLFNESYVFGEPILQGVDNAPGSADATTATPTLADTEPSWVGVPAETQPTPAATSKAPGGADEKWYTWDGVTSLTMSIPSGEDIRSLWFPIVPSPIYVTPGQAPGAVMHTVLPSSGENVPMPSGSQSVTVTTSAPFPAPIDLLVSAIKFPPTKRSQPGIPNDLFVTNAPFSADATGATDSSAAILQTIAQAQANTETFGGPSVVSFPSGNYLYDSATPIVVPDGVQIIAYGDATITAGPSAGVGWQFTGTTPMDHTIPATIGFQESVSIVNAANQTIRAQNIDGGGNGNVIVALDNGPWSNLAFYIQKCGGLSSFGKIVEVTQGGRGFVFSLGAFDQSSQHVVQFGFFSDGSTIHDADITLPSIGVDDGSGYIALSSFDDFQGFAPPYRFRLVNDSTQAFLAATVAADFIDGRAVLCSEAYVLLPEITIDSTPATFSFFVAFPGVQNLTTGIVILLCNVDADPAGANNLVLMGQARFQGPNQLEIFVSSPGTATTPIPVTLAVYMDFSRATAAVLT